MTIYIDILFLENFILNFIILYATGVIAKTKVKFLKIARWKPFRGYLCSNNLFPTKSIILESYPKNFIICCYGLSSIYPKNMEGNAKNVNSSYCVDYSIYLYN